MNTLTWYLEVVLAEEMNDGEPTEEEFAEWKHIAFEGVEEAQVQLEGNYLTLTAIAVFGKALTNSLLMAPVVARFEGDVKCEVKFAGKNRILAPRPHSDRIAEFAVDFRKALAAGGLVDDDYEFIFHEDLAE